ncbi:hypothetical protein A6A27_31470 [Micromonospora sp. CB01531]|nr:hypothetical protein A6A27_31470 [Micromonospora sp. CB01531]
MLQAASEAASTVETTAAAILFIIVTGHPLSAGIEAGFVAMARQGPHRRWRRDRELFRDSNRLRARYCQRLLQ